MSRILVIDDDCQLKDAIVEILEAEEYDVWGVGSVKEAIQCIDSQISVVICDIVMPVETGIEFIPKVREHYPNVKIIAISGGIEGKHTDHYLKSAEIFGADAVLKKPFKFSELISLVEKYI